MQKIDLIFEFSNSLSFSEKAPLMLLKHFLGEDMAAVYQLYLNELKTLKSNNPKKEQYKVEHTQLRGVKAKETQERQDAFNSAVEVHAQKLEALHLKYKVVLDTLQHLSALAHRAHDQISQALDCFTDELKHVNSNPSIFSTPESEIVEYSEADLPDDAPISEVKKFAAKVLNLPEDSIEYVEDDGDEFGYDEYLYVYGLFVNIVIKREGGKHGSYDLYMQTLEGSNDPIGIGDAKDFSRDIALHIGHYIQLHKPILGIAEDQFQFSKTA